MRSLSHFLTNRYQYRVRVIGIGLQAVFENIVISLGTGYPGWMKIGCDIESVQTFRDHWKNKRMSFFERIFSSDELKYCKNFKDPSPHFAVRFCAKEAVVKAASAFCKLLVTDIQILKEKNGNPIVKVWKKRKETSKFFKAHKILVSLSHTDEIGMACVLVQKKKD